MGRIVINIIVYGRKHTFTEPVNALNESLKELGHNVNKIYWYETNNDEIKFTDINLYIGDLRNRILKVNKKSLNIYFNTEQPLSCGLYSVKKYYEDRIDKFDVVIDMFKYQIVKPKKSIQRYCPVGWSPVFERNYNPTIKKSINLLHLGELQLKNSTIPNIRKLTTMKMCFYDERDIIIQKSHMNLSLQTFHPDYEWTQYRMLYVLGLRGFLIAEKHMDYGPYTPGKHFIIFDDLESCYNEWINRPKDMIEFGINAYEDIKKNHPYTMYLEKALKGIL